VLFFHSKNYVQNLTKNGLGYTLGDYFKNSSGHPGPNPTTSEYTTTTPAFFKAEENILVFKTH
jgi:hypothetical protein